MAAGRLFLLPSYVHPENTKHDVHQRLKEVLCELTTFLVENVRTSRRYISSLDLGLQIDALDFTLFDKRTTLSEVTPILDQLLSGTDVGLLSEAGLPCLADPGGRLVAWAHRHGISVIPIAGPSAIALTIVGSGFSGQTFTFHGYLPIDKAERNRRLTQLVQEVRRTGYTQVFMEVPHRNEQLMDAMIALLPPNQWLSVGWNLGSDNGRTISKPIVQWKQRPELHKQLAVFALGKPLDE